MSQVAQAVSKALNTLKPTMLQLAAATGSAYDSEWIIKLQAGMTYHAIELETNLLEVATIKRITLDKGGVPVAYASNEYLDFLDKAYQKHQKTGRFVFDLSKFEYRTIAGIFQTQFITTINDDVTIKIYFGVKGATDPAVPTLKGKAWVTDTVELPVFDPMRYELSLQSNSTDNLIYEFGKNGSMHKKLQRVVFKENNVAISRIIVKRGKATLHEMTRADLDFALQRHAGIALQAGYCLLDFAIFGFGTFGMPTHGLSFELEVDGPGSIKTYIEGYEQIRFPQQNAA